MAHDNQIKEPDDEEQKEIAQRLKSTNLSEKILREVEVILFERITTEEKTIPHWERDSYDAMVLQEINDAVLKCAEISFEERAFWMESLQEKWTLTEKELLKEYGKEKDDEYYPKIDTGMHIR